MVSPFAVFIMSQFHQLLQSSVSRYQWMRRRRRVSGRVRRLGRFADGWTCGSLQAWRRRGFDRLSDRRVSDGRQAGRGRRRPVPIWLAGRRRSRGRRRHDQPDPTRIPPPHRLRRRRRRQRRARHRRGRGLRLPSQRARVAPRN
jgi:hypothetical protein